MLHLTNNLVKKKKKEHEGMPGLSGVEVGVNVRSEVTEIIRHFKSK